MFNAELIAPAPSASPCLRLAKRCVTASRPAWVAWLALLVALAGAHVARGRGGYQSRLCRGTSANRRAGCSRNNHYKPFAVGAAVTKRGNQGTVLKKARLEPETDPGCLCASWISYIFLRYVLLIYINTHI